MTILPFLNQTPVVTASAQERTLPHTDAAAQAAELTRVFNIIGNTRMQGVPVLHPGLVAEAVGFEAYADASGAEAALGILITPWFMNLIWLPLQGQIAVPIGQVCERRFSGECFEFIGADEATFGTYEMCSLFSPMFEFADQEAAHATAAAVLAALRRDRTSQPVPASAAINGRRAFLSGRVASRAGERT